jgi:hypothetical protein
MSFTNKINKLIIFSFLLIFINCATSSSGITTSNIPVVNRKYTVLGPVQNTETWYTFDVAIFGFPLDKPPIDKIVGRAISDKNADALINIKYWQDKIIVLFITVNRIGISAEAIKFEDDGSIKNSPKK